jgi:hypothetical protein
VREDVARLTQRLEHMAQSLEYDMAKVRADMYMGSIREERREDGKVWHR